MNINSEQQQQEQQQQRHRLGTTSVRSSSSVVWFRSGTIIVLVGIVAVMNSTLLSNELRAISDGSSSIYLLAAGSNTDTVIDASFTTGQNKENKNKDYLNVTTKTTTTGDGGALLSDLLLTAYPEGVWDRLLRQTTALPNGLDKGQIAVVEVGMHRAKQCVEAAKAGFQAHCIEPSPKSYKRVQVSVQEQPQDVKGRVHLYNVAAGSEETVVPFVSSGGTGDHVGKLDMWKMEAIPDGDQDTKGTVIEVQSRRLDVLLADMDEKLIYLLKVDTQGFEPAVFSGIDALLSNHKVQYVLTEYWPRGMDMIAGKPERTCWGVTAVLQKLVRYGYRLYALPLQSHPKAPPFTSLKDIQSTMPLADFDSNCQWYYDLEVKYPSTEYKMGYWTDILAVAPDVDFDPKSVMGFTAVV